MVWQGQESKNALSRDKPIVAVRLEEFSAGGNIPQHGRGTIVIRSKGTHTGIDGAVQEDVVIILGRGLVDINQCGVTINGTIQSGTVGFHVGSGRLQTHALNITRPVVIAKGVAYSSSRVVMTIIIMMMIPVTVVDWNANVARADQITGLVRYGGKNAETGAGNGRFGQVQAAIHETLWLWWLLLLWLLLLLLLLFWCCLVVVVVSAGLLFWARHGGLVVILVVVVVAAAFTCCCCCCCGVGTVLGLICLWTYLRWMGVGEQHHGLLSCPQKRCRTE